MATFSLIGGTVNLGTGNVTNDTFSNTSGDELDADKIQHIYKMGSNFDLAIGATPVAREEIVWVASTAGTVRAFKALLNDTGTTTNVNFDLKKNGTTVLSSTINVTNSDSDRQVKSGTLSSAAFVADDVFSVELTVTTSTGAQGPFCWADFEELAG